MWIEEMPREAAIEFLARMQFGRLGCANAGQPYVTPFFFALHSDSLYSFATLGQKITWMRGNPLVCVEADEVVTAQRWVSVVVLGRYEEFPNEPAFQRKRKLAHSLLQQRPMWWEPGFAKTVVQDRERPLEPVYFRVKMDRVSGHRTVSDQ
jgi:uncharacterized protein